MDQCGWAPTTWHATKTWLCTCELLMLAGIIESSRACKIECDTDEGMAVSKYFIK